MKLENQTKASQLINNLFKIKGVITNVNQDKNNYIFIDYFGIKNIKVDKKTFINLINHQKYLDEKELRKL